MTEGFLTDPDITAKDLSGDHLECWIRFNWEFPTSKVQATVQGWLREVHHPGGTDVYVNLAGEESEGAKAEFCIPSDTPVHLTDPLQR